MKRKVYLLCSKSSSPETSGGKRRIMQNLEMLSAVYDAELLPYEKQKGVWNKVHYFIGIRKKLAQSGLCIVEEPKYIFTTLFLPVRCIYSSHNFETALRWGFWRSEKSFRTLLRFLLFFAGEFLAIRKAEAVIAISDRLKEQLGRYTRRPIFAILPFPDVQSEVQIHPSEENRYICAGSFDWTPNFEGYRFFVQEVLPKLNGKKRLFYFVGKNNSRIPPVMLNGSEVICRDYIEDLDEFYADMKGVVIPIVSGSGIKIKLIEAIAKGLPIVTTLKGAEGLEQYANSIEAAIDGDAFAKRIMAVENDPQAAAAVTLKVREDLRQSVQRQRRAFFAFLERSK